MNKSDTAISSLASKDVGDKLKFVYVGRLNYDKKGVDILLKALDRIIKIGGGTAAGV